MRARGLKHRQREGSQGRSLSRPMRARGLKPDHLSSCPEAEEVASHAGAWIEICPESLNVVSRILKAIHNSKDVKERKVQVWSRRLSG